MIGPYEHPPAKADSCPVESALEWASMLGKSSGYVWSEHGSHWSVYCWFKDEPMTIGG